MNMLYKLVIVTGLVSVATANLSTASAAPAEKPDLIPITKTMTQGKISVRNIGKAQSRSSWLTIQCLSTGCPEHPAMSGYKNVKFPNALAIQIPALKSGASFSHQLSFWKQLTFKPGNTKFMIMADAGKDIKESSETNNKVVFVYKAKAKLGFKAQTLPAKAGNNPHTGTQFTGGNLKADLIVKPYYQNASLPDGFPGQSFCEQSLSGGAAKNIWFQVKNNGHAIASPSQVRILINTFVGSGTSQIVNQNIPSLAMGQSQVVKVALPEGCYPVGFSSSCHFRIVVDSNYQVPEMNESNNSVDSKCVNPAG